MRNKFIVSLGISLFLSISLFGCGGGGGSSPPPPTPSIQAILFSIPTGSVLPANFKNAVASVTDPGTNITTATVVMNGVTLTYNASLTHQDYEGNVTVSPGGRVALSATVGGNTYSASGTQFMTYPTISSPVSGATFTASMSNTVTWSEGAPLANAAYLIGVLDAADPNGGTPYFQAVSAGTNSFSIPANSLTVGSGVLIVGITIPVKIPAVTGSALVIGGFNYVPITVNP
jgi:hypothetical protein